MNNFIDFGKINVQIAEYNWGYKADPSQGSCLGLRGGVCNWPKGKIILSIYIYYQEDFFICNQLIVWHDR